MSFNRFSRLYEFKGRVHDYPGFSRLYNSEPSMGRGLKVFKVKVLKVIRRGLVVAI